MGILCLSTCEQYGVILHGMFIVMDIINTTCADIKGNCRGQNKTEKAQKCIADKKTRVFQDVKTFVILVSVTVICPFLPVD